MRAALQIGGESMEDIAYCEECKEKLVVQNSKILKDERGIVVRRFEAWCIKDGCPLQHQGIIFNVEII